MGITPSFVMDLESNMSIVMEDEYARLSSNLWWDRVMKTRPSKSRRELMSWLLSTAQIHDLEENGGKMVFDDLVSKMTEHENRHAGNGLRLKKSEFEDLDGKGMEQAAKWAADTGAMSAYWPQKIATQLLKNGHTATGYDGLAYFHNAHPLNPFRTGLGTYANIFTGAAASTPSTDPNDAGYPGACPIDDSVTVDVALTNLSKLRAYIRSIRMPNGSDPRFLRPVGILGPPRMEQRVVQLTNARTIAQAAGSGAGSADVEAVIKSFGFSQPIIADELSGFESETTFFLICEEVAASSEVGGLIYSEREAFRTNFYGAVDEAQLNRMDQMEWHNKGRNVGAYGHPYCIFKCKGS